jgi:large subunit ribosomal protein L3
MKFALGTKQSMTQVFDESGRVFPATFIKVSPMTVTQVKNVERDGYVAIQLGAGVRKEKNINKAQQSLGSFASIREFRVPTAEGMEKGATLDISVFEVGDTIEVAGTSKGKGFQGVVKRHNFSGGPRTHGQKHSEREPGSIGATGPQRVFKGVRMAGRMGTDRITVKNLTVLQIDIENGILVVSGSVPGRRGTLLEIREKGLKAKARKE